MTPANPSPLPSESPLHAACRREDIPALAALLKDLPPDTPDASGESALALAVRLDSPRCVQMLLAAGADPFSKTTEGEGAFWVAAKSGLHACFEPLLHAAAARYDLDGADFDLLEIAVRNQDRALIGILHRAGIRVHLVKHFNRSHTFELGYSDTKIFHFLRDLFDLGFDLALDDLDGGLTLLEPVAKEMVKSGGKACARKEYREIMHLLMNSLLPSGFLVPENAEKLVELTLLYLSEYPSLVKRVVRTMAAQPYDSPAKWDARLAKMAMAPLRHKFEPRGSEAASRAESLALVCQYCRSPLPALRELLFFPVHEDCVPDTVPWSIRLNRSETNLLPVNALLAYSRVFGKILAAGQDTRLLWENQLDFSKLYLSPFLDTALPILNLLDGEFPPPPQVFPHLDRPALPSGLRFLRIARWSPETWEEILPRLLDENPACARELMHNPSIPTRLKGLVDMAMA